MVDGAPQAPPGSGETNTLAIVSLVFGILSFASVICCCVPVLNWAAMIAMLIFGLTAIITGVVGLGRARVTGRGKTEAVVGIVLGSVWMAAALLGGILLFAGCAGLGALGAVAGATGDGATTTSPPPFVAPSTVDPGTGSGGGGDLVGAEPIGEGAAPTVAEAAVPSEVWLDAPCAPLGYSASRTLTVSSSESYPIENAFDGDNDTAWAVRDAVPGAEWIEISLAPGTRVSRLWLTTGFEKIHRRSGDLFPLNAHLRRFTIVTDAGSRAVEVRSDERAADIRLNATTASIRIVVDEVWPGERWQDLSISEIEVHCAR